MLFFSFALMLCVFCRDAVVGCGGLLRSVCCKRLLNVVEQATKAALNNWLTIMTSGFLLLICGVIFALCCVKVSCCVVVFFCRSVVFVVSWSGWWCFTIELLLSLYLVVWGCSKACVVEVY